ncbi:MAG: CapA family protein [Aliarcobacter skirrowii]|uniref:CapA family protein n=1 Tax=Aliarcobacter skirrowii TaxID=28200 RepID=UPI00242AE128|nr:CapA family protein [Aliarcobacter skirrowii]MDD2509164.1 CapA family protein [Aliarcobacter skirrowii]MDD3496535.1 CapA family protein [Aliarcobacter skirrowii]
MGVKIFACGDIVNKIDNHDFIDNRLKQIINECDLSICNFEAPIISDGSPIPKAGPHIYQSKDTVEYLKKIGFNLLTLANNHIYDYGEEGLKETIEEIESNQLLHVGAGMNKELAYKPLILEVSDLKIGVIAGSEDQFGCLSDPLGNESGYAWINSSMIDQSIINLKKEVDFIILSVHAGAENTYIPLPEWRERYQYLCELGVDIILGHHPHVPQGYEKYKDSHIFYSLGNFYFNTAGHQNNTNDSFSLIIDIEKKVISNIEFIYHKMENQIVRYAQANEINFNIDNLNNILGNNYKKHVDVLVKEYYDAFYLNYYRSALSYSDTMNVNKGLLLLHNIRIDTHRYVVQRALSNIYEGKK